MTCLTGGPFALDNNAVRSIEAAKLKGVREALVGAKHDVSSARIGPIFICIGQPRSDDQIVNSVTIEIASSAHRDSRLVACHPIQDKTTTGQRISEGAQAHRMR